MILSSYFLLFTPDDSQRKLLKHPTIRSLFGKSVFIPTFDQRFIKSVFLKFSLWKNLQLWEKTCVTWEKTLINPSVLNAPFLYHLKTSENLKFKYTSSIFQVVRKCCHSGEIIFQLAIRVSQKLYFTCTRIFLTEFVREGRSKNTILYIFKNAMAKKLT